VASIDKRPNGKWRARWREYPGGPQRSQAFGRKVDAQRHLVDVEHRLQTGTYVTPEVARVTLAEWTAAHLERQAWRPATRSTASAAMAHALAVFGDRPLASIRRGDVQAFLAGLKMAPGSVRLVRQHFTTTMQAAVDDGLIVRNPASRLKVAGDSPVEVVPPTVEQVQALYEAAPEWFRVAVVMGAGLGLRQAEASGLTVDRVDWLRERSVRIDRQWATKSGTGAFAPPKSAASSRSIPAAATVLAELGRHVGSDPTAFVLTLNGDGVTPVDHNRFGVTWRRMRDEAEVPGMRFHALRHHFASALISAGCSVVAVQKALGHASASVTLNCYGHLWPGDDDRIREAVEAAFSPAEDSLRTDRVSDSL
jgi:integrase